MSTLVPIGVVTSLRAKMVTTQGFNVTFKPPNIHEVYGKIIAYHLRVNRPFISSSIVVLTNKTWFLFENFQPYTTYTVEIAVANEMGAGKYSDPLKVKTLTGGKNIFIVEYYIDI